MEDTYFVVAHLHLVAAEAAMAPARRDHRHTG
jgi:heme/copper-type cytochrome/quinol oxidase subunit 1